MVNIIDTTVFSRLPAAERSKLIKPSGRMKLVSAGGDQLKFIGTIRLDLQLHGQDAARSVVFSVCDGMTSPVLLGMDFISHEVKQFNFDEMTLKLKNSEIPVQCNFTDQSVQISLTRSDRYFSGLKSGVAAEM